MAHRASSEPYPDHVKKTVSKSGRTAKDMSVSALAAAEMGGSDYNDPTSTNVHLHPLPANICEADLGQLFSQFGPVGTVKIMWPREEAFSSLGGQRLTQAAGLGGFVAMMDRRSAEKAFKGMDGFNWNGSTIHTTWGKGVPLPYKPLFRT